jgi:hypothetical protein
MEPHPDGTELVWHEFPTKQPIYETDSEGRPLPCIEFEHFPDGFPESGPW